MFIEKYTIKYFNMQLKTVGQSLNALNSMQNILNDTSLVGTRLNVALSNSLNAYSIETVKAAIAQGKQEQQCLRLDLGQLLKGLEFR